MSTAVRFALLILPVALCACKTAKPLRDPSLAVPGIKTALEEHVEAEARRDEALEHLRKLDVGMRDHLILLNVQRSKLLARNELIKVDEAGLRSALDETRREQLDSRERVLQLQAAFRGALTDAEWEDVYPAQWAMMWAFLDRDVITGPLFDGERGQPEALADRLVEMVSDPVLAQELSAEARSLAAATDEQMAIRDGLVDQMAEALERSATIESQRELVEQMDDAAQTMLALSLETRTVLRTRLTDAELWKKLMAARNVFGEDGASR